MPKNSPPAPTPPSKPAAAKTAPVPTKKASRPAKKAASASVPKPPDAPTPVIAKEPKKLPKLPPRLVRDSFTMPEADFALIAALKASALRAQRAAKKSELLRAALRSLAALDSKALVAALDALEPVKTGRPKKGH